MSVVSRPTGKRQREFIAVAEFEQLALNAPMAVEAAGRSICLLRTDDELLAFTDSCPHRGHPLSKASCRDGVLRCALHGWEFGLPGGQATSPRAPFGLELFAARVVDGTVEIAVGTGA